MQLEDYKYAGPYINKCREVFKVFRRLAENAQFYYDIMTHITQVYKVDGGISSSNPYKTTDRLVNYIMAKDEKNAFFEQCMRMCAYFFLLEEKEGAKIIIYQDFLDYKIDKVENLMNCSRVTCWRLRNRAIEELDYVLSKKSVEEVNRVCALADAVDTYNVV